VGYTVKVKERYFRTKYRLLGILFKPLNPELNPICYLLALLAHHFLHLNRIKVKSLTITCIEI